MGEFKRGDRVIWRNMRAVVITDTGRRVIIVIKQGSLKFRRAVGWWNLVRGQW